MNRLIRFFLENHKLTIILSMMFIIFGIMGLFTLNAESYPTVNFATATIETRYTGATAEDIRTKITKPIEDKIREVSGLKDVRSVSKSGLSSIYVRVDMDNEDEEEVLEELQKAVDSVSDLPSDLREDPVYTEINSEEFPAVELAITGSNENRARDLMSDHLKEELEDSKKVKDVRLVGWTKRQFNIRLDQKKMEGLHIGLEEVLRKVRQRNVDIPGGELKGNGTKKLIRVEGKVQSVEELGEVVVRSNFSGKSIRLKDIATIEDSAEDATILSNFNGRPATFLIVNKKGGADTIALVDEVNAIVERFKEQYKDQFEITIYNNEALKVRKKLDILSSNALSGLALVIFFLFLFLPGKIGVMASISLPLAVLATIGFMPVFGMNLDAITILALVIALGMMVDNSVVISENFARLKNDEGMRPFEAALESVRQLWLPITCTAFTTVAAFLPMLVTKGIMGQFIKYIPIVVCIALMLSLVESFFLLPMRLRFSGSGGKSSKVQEEHTPEKDWFHKFIVKFEAMMEVLVRRRILVLFGFGAIIFGSLILMAVGNKFILFPAEQTEIYVGRVEMPRGTTLEVTDKKMAELSKEIKEQMGDWAKYVTARAGVSSLGPTDPKGGTGDIHGLVLVYASDFAKYNIDDPEYLARLRKVGLDGSASLSYEAQVNGPPVGDAINATFRSNDVKSLDAVIGAIKDRLSKVEGVRDLKVNDILGEQEVKVLIDYPKADQLGLSVDAIGNAIRTALSGTMASQVILNNKEVDLNVRYKDSYRTGQQDISSIKVMDAMGNLVPVSTVAKTELTSGQYEIKRFDFKRSKTLSGGVDESLITSQEANGLLKKYYDEINKDYPGVSLVFGGQAESTKESMQSLGQAGILALMGIFGLLVFLFGSYIRPLIIMSTIPLGLIGFSVAFFFHDRPVSFMALIGIIGLAGIIVNSGIVLISFIEQLREEGKMGLDEILVKASGMRVRAVLVTSLTTISGLLPTAYGIGGSDSMLIPMTLAMAWGLTSGTVLTLIWVPCAYALLEDWNRFLHKVPVLNFFATTSKEHENEGIQENEQVESEAVVVQERLQ